MALYPGAPKAVTSSAKTKRPSSRPVTTKPAAPTFDWTAFAQSLNQPVNYAALSKIANQQAAGVANTQVAGLRADQQAILAAAQRQAAQQQQAALASSRYLEGLKLGDSTAADYANAAAAERAAAQGYSGALRTTVDDAAAQVQANLAAAGSPQTAVNQGANAANALYGLGGNLPAQTLDVVGPTVAASMRALPAQTLGYGQQLAAGALGAGRESAGKYDIEIAKARAEQAVNAARYLQDLSEQARADGKDRVANILNVLKIKQDQVSQDALNAYREGQLGISQQRADTADVNAKNAAIYKENYFNYLQAGLHSRDAHNQAMESVAQANAATSAANAQTARINATKPDAPHTYQDVYGRQVVLNADGTQQAISPGIFKDDSSGVTYSVGTDGKRTAITKPDTKKTATKGGFTPSFVRNVSRDITNWKTGRPGTTSQAEIKPLNYDAALTQAVAQGPATKEWRKKATQLVNAQYGDPVAVTNANAIKLKKGGARVVEQLTSAVQADKAGQIPYPLHFVIEAIARAYNLPVAALAPIVSELSG